MLFFFNFFFFLAFPLYKKSQSDGFIYEMNHIADAECYERDFGVVGVFEVGEHPNAYDHEVEEEYAHGDAEEVFDEIPRRLAHACHYRPMLQACNHAEIERYYGHYHQELAAAPQEGKTCQDEDCGECQKGNIVSLHSFLLAIRRNVLSPWW